MTKWLVVVAIAGLTWCPLATVSAQEDPAPEDEAGPAPELEVDAASEDAGAEEAESADDATGTDGEGTDVAEADDEATDGEDGLQEETTPEPVTVEEPEEPSAEEDSGLAEADAELEAMFEASAAEEPAAEADAEVDVAAQGDAAPDDETKDEPSVPERDHGIIFARLELGVGFGMADQIASSDVHASGLSVAGSASLGVGVTNDFAVHLEGFGAFVPAGGFSTQHRHVEVEFDESSTLMTYAAGIGVTHWLSPGDFYVKAAGGAAWGSMQVDGIDIGDPGLGWGLSLGAGKNFWLGEQLAVGVGLYFMYMSVPDGGPARSHDGPLGTIGSNHKFNYSNFGVSTSVAFN